MSDSTSTSDAAAVLTIDLAAIAANWRLLRDVGAPAECAAGVKADAYGLGADKVAPVLHEAGCRTFFVATLEEGISLARHVAGAIIYGLNGPMPGEAAAFIRHGVRPVLNSLEQVAAWRAAGAGPPAGLHLDTGLNRLGLPPCEVETLIAEPARLSGVEVALLMSHLACADTPDHPHNEMQRLAFAAAYARLVDSLGARDMPPLASLASSSGIFLGSAYHFDLTRPGAALYGISPLIDQANPMRQVVALQAKVIQVRCVDSGDAVGYGATHRFTRPARLAIVGAGYADGYFRSLGGRGSAYIGEQRVPVVGRVSMDLITLDVSDVAPERVHPGTSVDLIGPRNPIDMLARDAGTIGYEMLTALGRRYRRRYIGAA